MGKSDKLSNDHITILRFVYENKHVTVADIQRLLPLEVSRRGIERRTKYLVERGYLDTATFADLRRLGRSPRYFHVLLKGARTIGKDSVGNQHYRIERPEFYRHRMVLVELRSIATGVPEWEVVTDEKACQRTLQSFLERLTKATGTPGQTSVVYHYLPAKIAPDAVLRVGSEALVVVIGHPHAGKEFWRRRLAKYEKLLTARALRIVAVVLDDRQKQEAQTVCDRSPFVKRVLTLQTDQLQQLTERLSKPAR